ncbi:MAG: polyprenol monophosphomannose synthase [Candidatus Komeilibacteria bacterium]|nr:polyprenol monophosphomannose synthase [Candidatus Komeilibacteria bacterium]
MISLTIIVPTYQEAENIGLVLAGLKEVLASLDTVKSSILIVDDSPDDKTKDATLAAAGQLKPLSIQYLRRQRRGLATAVIDGVNIADTEYILVMDGDLSHPPSIIAKMIQYLAGHDLIIGSRLLPGGMVEQWPRHRYLMSRFATKLAVYLTQHVSDPLSGLFLIRKAAVDWQSLRPLGYKILLEILVRHPELKIKEIPYTFTNRQAGTSKINWLISWQYLRHWHRLWLAKKK